MTSAQKYPRHLAPKLILTIDELGDGGTTSTRTDKYDNLDNPVSDNHQAPSP